MIISTDERVGRQQNLDATRGTQARGVLCRVRVPKVCPASSSESRGVMQGSIQGIWVGFRLRGDQGVWDAVHLPEVSLTQSFSDDSLLKQSPRLKSMPHAVPNLMMSDFSKSGREIG